MFLKGCKDVDREQMRIALHTHTSKMTFTFTTEFPILGVGPSVCSLVNSTTPQGSARRSVTSPFKSPSVSNPFRSPSPPGSNRAFKSPGPVPDIPRSIFNRRQASGAAAATPVSTPNLKKGANPDSSSVASPFASIRTASGGVRSGVVRGGMTVGGAGRLFKPLPITPKGKDKSFGADDSDSSAGSPLSDDPYPKRSDKRTASAKKNKSPFEVAARKAERNKHLDSDSTSDFEIPLGKPKSIGSAKLGLRKISSAKSEKKMIPKKGSGGMMDSEDDDVYSEDREDTPSKKQKTVGKDGAVQAAAIELD